MLKIRRRTSQAVCMTHPDGGELCTITAIASGRDEGSEVIVAIGPDSFVLRLRHIGLSEIEFGISADAHIDILRDELGDHDK